MVQPRLFKLNFQRNLIMASFDDIVSDADSVIMKALGRAVTIRKPADGRRYNFDAVVERSVEIADANGITKRYDIASFKNEDWPFIDKGDELILSDTEVLTVHNELSSDESITTVFLRLVK